MPPSRLAQGRASTGESTSAAVSNGTSANVGASNGKSKSASAILVRQQQCVAQEVGGGEGAQGVSEYEKQRLERIKVCERGCVFVCARMGGRRRVNKIDVVTFCPAFLYTTPPLR